MRGPISIDKCPRCKYKGPTIVIKVITDLTEPDRPNIVHKCGRCGYSPEYLGSQSKDKK